MPEAKNRLHVDEILTVGFVDKGDDPEAELVFFKRHEEKNGPMDKFMKMLRGLGKNAGMSDTEVDKLLADGVDDSSTNDGDLNKNGDGHMTLDVTKLEGADKEAFDAAVADAVTAKLAAENDDDVKLDELPEAVAKRLTDAEDVAKAASERAEAAEVRIQKLEDEKERSRYITKAASLDLPGAPADDLAEILRKADGALSEEEREKFDEILKSASKAIAEGALYGEIGSGGGSETSTMGEVRELAKALQAEDPKLSYQMAEAKVWEARPDLYNKHRRETPARTVED